MSRGALGVRSFQTMVPMRDGARLNTFVFLPENGGPRFPVILHRTPYGIAAAGARDKFDHTNAWLPSAAEPMRGSILRGWRNIVASVFGYAGRHQANAMKKFDEVIIIVAKFVSYDD